MAWRSYLGLPHAFGADPEDGQAADCLVMVFRILDELGLPHPPLDPAWLDMARAGRWNELQTLWTRRTEAVPNPPEDGAVALIQNGPAGLGVGIVLEGGLLMVHHRRGVVWAPLHVLRPLTFHRFL